MTEPLTRQRIRSMREAITPGEWRSWWDQFGDLSGFTVSGSKSEGIAVMVGHVGQNCSADAEFIAASPSIVDFYESALSEAEREIERLKSPPSYVVNCHSCGAKVELFPSPTVSDPTNGSEGDGNE